MILIENGLFEGTPVTVTIGKYNSGGYAIVSTHFDAISGEHRPFCYHTVDMPGLLESDEVAIREYGNSKESLAFLYAWDIVGHPVKFADNEFVQGIPICKLTKDVISKFSKRWEQ